MDLTLPREIPDMVEYREKPDGLLPFAVYKLVELDDDASSALIASCASDLPAELHEKFRWAPRASWTGESLQSVIQYHVQLNREQRYDFFYFVAVTSKSWEADGVLVVALDAPDDDDDEVCTPDKIMMPADQAGSNLINLQIANTDWYEVKEAFADSEQQSPPPPSAAGNRPGPVGGSDELDFRDDAPDKRPPAGFYIGIYTSQGVDFEDVLRQVQPAYRQQPRDDFICRFEGQLPSGSDLVVEACKRHPLRCMANRHLAREVFVVADSANIADDGVLLGSMRWDGDVTNRSVAEAADVWAQAPHLSRRLICQTPMIVPNVCDIASGRSGFDGRRR